MTDAPAEDRDATLARVLGDPLMQAMEALRAATWRLVWWPWSIKRHHAVLLALEDVMVIHVNRLLGLSGTAVIGPIERLQSRVDRAEVHLGRIETRLFHLDQQVDHLSHGGGPHERAAGESRE